MYVDLVSNYWTVALAIFEYSELILFTFWLNAVLE